MRRKSQVRDASAPAAPAAAEARARFSLGRGGETLRVPDGYSPSDWLDTSDTMGLDDPDSVEEVTVEYGGEEG